MLGSYRGGSSCGREGVTGHGRVGGWWEEVRLAGAWSGMGDCGGVGGMQLVGREEDSLYVSVGDGGGVWLMERGLVAVVERGWRGMGSCGVVSSCGR